MLEKLKQQENGKTAVIEVNRNAIENCWLFQKNFKRT